MNTSASSNKNGHHTEITSLTFINEVPISSVTVTEPYLVNAYSKELDYLLSFDNSKWLAGFRETAGLDMQGAERYGGWESMLIGGSAFGHYLSACAMAYNNPSISCSDRQKLSDILDDLLRELKICQDNSKGKKGFLFAGKLLDINNVEKQFDNVEESKSNIITEAWVPWYTMHKLLQGFVDVYNFTKKPLALDIARGLGDWSYDRASGWSEETHERVLGIEYGGMNDCLYDLYAATGEERYAIAAHYFDEDTLFEKVKTGAPDVLNNRHANTNIPKFVGALKRYYTVHGKTIGGERIDASAYLEYAKSFFTMVRDKHTYITGGNSEWEHFGRDCVLNAERTNANNETCNIYNMMKLARMLYQITGDSQYCDFYENAYINSILSSQNPETGMTTYFQPMATGFFKTYGERYTKFWCCTGTGMENFSKLSDSIYFVKDSNIIVNLYLSSILNNEENSLEIEQKSNVLHGGNAVFTVKTIKINHDLTIWFRVPDWAERKVNITVNNQPAVFSLVDGFVCISRKWTVGDRIEVTFPMKVKAYPLPDDESSIAFKYGPLVLSARLGMENMLTTMTGVAVTIPAAKIVDSEYIYLPKGVTREMLFNDTSAYLIKNENSEEPEFNFVGSDLCFTPHYANYTERYGIYWYFVSEEEFYDKTGKPSQTRDKILDTVQPGYGQYENDDLHDMKEFHTMGVTNDGTYRFAEHDGYFTYRMVVKPEEQNYLEITLRRADNGKTLKISCGEDILFTDTLDYIGTEDSYKVRIPVAYEVIERNGIKIWPEGGEKRVICVTFQSNDNAPSARVCDFIYTLTADRLYETDKSLAYYVNCGAHNVYTLPAGDRSGIYNSVTEQLYGYDAATGRKWGLIDDPIDVYGGASKSNALYTANTWAYEYLLDEDAAKEDTCRYTKNQYENGVNPRFLDYGFELPDGCYTVEIGFSNPWGCSNNHDVYANIGTPSEQKLAENFQVTEKPLISRVEVRDGRLTLNFRNSSSQGLAINVTYILIRIQ